MSNGRKLRRSITKPKLSRNQLLRQNEALLNAFSAASEREVELREEHQRRERLKAAGILLPGQQ